MTTVQMRTRFINESVVIQKATYPNGSTALLLKSENGEPLGYATAVLEELPANGHVFIKDWNENDGVLDALQQAGIVGPVVRSVPAGFVAAQEVELLADLPNAR